MNIDDVSVKEKHNSCQSGIISMEGSGLPRLLDDELCHFTRL